MAEPPAALVLGCNTPHGLGVLSDWIEEQTGHAPDFHGPGWSDGKSGFSDGGGYGHGMIFDHGDGYGSGSLAHDGTGYGDGGAYGRAHGDGWGDGECYGSGHGYETGFHDDIDG